MDRTRDVAGSRDALIERFGVLRDPPSRELDAVVELVALVCGVPKAAVNIIDDSHQHQVATTGVAPTVCTREDSMCAVVLEEEEPVVVPDARSDRRFHDNPFVTGELDRVRFYASSALVTHDGDLLGRLCVFDEQPRDLDEAQRQALATLAARVVDVLELRLRSRQLTRSLHQLEQARDELRVSNERLAMFAGRVSHDLRTPLTAILLNLETLSRHPAFTEGAPPQRLLRGAIDGVRRMARLVDEVLAFASLGGRLHLADVHLAEVLDEVVADLHPLIARCGGEVVAESLQVAVKVDRQQLYSVLLNLVSNAVKFARPGHPPQIAVRAVSSPDQVTVEVRDNGRGIAPDRIGNVFDLFDRGDGSMPGAGIGLATVRSAVEAHGGRVGVRSLPGEGSTFWFTLPAQWQA